MKFRSIVNTQHQALFALLQMHNHGNPIELDPMYNRGEIYNAAGLIQHPKKRYDLYAHGINCLKGDALHLQLASKSIHSVMLDPPWLISKDSTKMTERFSSVNTRAELKTLIHGILKEADRVLIENGLLIFKCQDCNNNRRKWFMHFWVIKCALKIGFNPIDMIIVNAPSRMRSQTTSMHQDATHSFHSYLIAFRKKASRTAYK